MSLNAMNVVFIVPRLDKPSTRYRILQYQPHLEEAGISSQVIPFSKVRINWARLWTQLRAADVVFVQKRLASCLESVFLRSAAANLIYDFDDAVMFKDDAAGQFASRRQMKRFRKMVQQSDLVIAGNHYLKAQAENCSSGRIITLPTPVDEKLYPRKPQSSGQKEITLGWIGSRSTLKYLVDIIPALEELGRRYPTVKLKIVADEFFDMHDMEVISEPWTASGELEALHSFDIGLMPLRDDVWTRGKCGFKLLQYMAVGLPVVCTPVGINAEIVSSGVEGYWARTMADWIEKIECLILNTQLRDEMGQCGHTKFKKYYSLEVNAPKFVEAISNVTRQDGWL